MRITLFAHGLRGDIWPTVALGWRLAERDHDVTVAAPEESQGFVERAGLRFVPLPFPIETWLRTAEGQRFLSAGGIRVFREIGRQYDRHAEAFDDAFQVAAQGAEALIGGLITVERAVAMGDLLRVPVAMLSQYPVAPSREYPSITMARGSLRVPALNRACGTLAYRIWLKSSEKPVRAFRAKLGLPPKARPPFYRLCDSGAPILHTLSRSLFPRPADWAENIKITGAWQMPAALRESLGEGVPPALEQWLGEGDPPVFLGFGSMPVLDPEPLLADIVAVTEALGLRAIVSENCVSGAAAKTLPRHLHVVGAVDHDLLFPRCRAVVHHGGLGSTIASLRAGRPTMACSVFIDQPWWGERMRRLGVGTHVPFRKLDRDSLQRGLSTLLDAAVEERAGVLAAAMAVEGDGLPEAAELLEDWLVVAGPTRGTGPSGRQEKALA